MKDFGVMDLSMVKASNSTIMNMTKSLRLLKEYTRTTRRKKGHFTFPTVRNTWDSLKERGVDRARAA